MADSGDSGEPSGALTVNIRCSNGSKLSVQASPDSTVAAFKALVAGQSDVPASQQRLIYKGRILKDDQTLESYGLESDHTVHLVRALPSTAPANTAAPPLNTSSTLSSNAGVARGVGSNEGRGLSGEGFGGLFPGLGINGLFGDGASGLSGDGFPELDQMQQQLYQNPNLMRELMNMPVIQDMMNNPELMRNLIAGNTQMREIMDRNPELAHVLNDPSTLRQSMEAARNPELMREMMRNTDRAMSNIESHPEGFNMLRRMYETVQEPLLNATTMTGDSGNGLGSNPFAALLNQDNTDSRNSLSNPSNNVSETAAGSPVPNANPLPNPWGATGGTQTTTRPTSASNARVTGTAGLGGLEIPDVDRMAGGMPDLNLLNQVMQNPAMGQMVQSLMSDPQYMNQVLNMNPQLRSMMESSPQLREMLQNPEILRQLSSPETLQQIMSLQSLLSQSGRQQSSQEQNQQGGGLGAPDNMGLDLLMNMFGGIGTGGPGFPRASNVPPEQLYATQLAQLQEMGFFDTQENIRALSATAGNVHAAVERLLGNLGP